MRKPNIVIVLLDTHRLDRLGCYGYRRGTSPNIDAFAERATLFERAMSPAQWTIPAHASLFTGEPPSAHMTVQSGQILPRQFPTLAELLRNVGYRTVGFCNNPLVGVIRNGFKRGFDAFYNYSGAIPSLPTQPTDRRATIVLRRAWARYTQILRRLTYPIQNAFAQSQRVFQAALHPQLVPLWTRFGHFKGDTVKSIRDATRFIDQQMPSRAGKPCLLYLNLMETHLPYSPPEYFVNRFAPRLQQDKQAQAFMRTLNTQALHWVTPAQEPMSDLELGTLSDMYDAEVAYQDHLLAGLFQALDRPEHQSNTLVVLVADHGEMLGEHQLMGHGFGVYQELVHVPLLIRTPGQTADDRVRRPVCTTRLFHTLLHAAGMDTYETHYGSAVDAGCLSLLSKRQGSLEPQNTVFSEAYSPDFALQLVKRYKPSLLETLHCQATHRAALGGTRKLIQIEGVSSQLFDVQTDPRELQSLVLPAAHSEIARLRRSLDLYLENAAVRQTVGGPQRRTDVDDDRVRQRLRGLGYTE